MRVIDRYAYRNRLRLVNPAYKLMLTICTIGLALTLDRIPVGLLAVVWMLGLTIGWAGLPWRTVITLVFGEGLFLALTVVGVAVSFNIVPVATAGWQWNAGPLWVSTSPTALDLAGRVIARSLGSIAAMNFLALTTPLVDIVELLRRIGVPALLVDLMATIYRSIFTLLDSMERMYTAQNTRLGYVGTLRAMRSAGTLASRLFIESYWRASRTQLALESRGFQGELRVLPLCYQRDARLIGAGVLMAISMLAARLWL
jgi:cobalt/nickel transport system permease protein